MYAHRITLPPYPLGLQLGSVYEEEGSGSGARAALQLCLFPGASGSFLYASRNQCLRWGCKKLPGAWKPLKLSERLCLSLLQQGKERPVYCSLSASFFGKRELLPPSTRVCLNAHDMRGPEEKNWTSDQAPVGNCSPPWLNPLEPPQKGAGPGGGPWCKSKRSCSPGGMALQPAA